MSKVADYQHRREIAAVENGHVCRLNDDGTYTVISDTTHDKRYDIEVKDVGGMLKFRCNCESGKKRRWAFVPCWHGARVARRLEREGKARWQHGHWFSTKPRPVKDPNDVWKAFQHD